jgi:cytochrome c-type biogenesis protein CcmH/NrfF
MSRWKSNVAQAFLPVLMVSAILAQTAADLESDNVKRVGSRLACKCGSCQSSVACEMPGGCGYCKRIKTEIVKQQSLGKSDQQIIDQMVQENGKDTYIGEPGIMGWLAPYLAVLAGLALIFWFVRRHLKAPTPATVPQVSPEVLNRYHERIEKDLEKLE